MITLPSVIQPEQLKAFKIKASDSNYFAFLVDPISSGINCTFIIEIYEPKGATPPNVHQFAYEFFFILKGEGRAKSGDSTMTLRAGDFLQMPPKHDHIVENCLDEKLYALCLMIPNEEFAEMIRAGQPVDLDEEDLRVIKRLSL